MTGTTLGSSFFWNPRNPPASGTPLLRAARRSSLTKGDGLACWDHAHRVRLDELHIRSLRCATIFGLCRPQSRSDQLRSSVARLHRVRFAWEGTRSTRSRTRIAHLVSRLAQPLCGALQGSFGGHVVAAGAFIFARLWLPTASVKNFFRCAGLRGVRSQCSGQRVGCQWRGARGG